MSYRAQMILAMSRATSSKDLQAAYEKKAELIEKLENLNTLLAKAKNEVSGKYSKRPGFDPAVKQVRNIETEISLINLALTKNSDLIVKALNTLPDSETTMLTQIITDFKGTSQQPLKMAEMTAM